MGIFTFDGLTDVTITYGESMENTGTPKLGGQKRRGKVRYI